ncbi:Na(+)/H(+) exchange regulatory cofactor NHE-RF3-like [Oncorhynchus masou masou]|uniref:Na(+)/H(+) exchange regulatory cofactor NHE-RF3-like n=1 Tax=Oncorhynchus masou masou TaxID=90313 RepID=UPI003183C689
MAGYKPRVIVLSKKPGHSFGFFLRVEKGEDGHLIRNLEMGGPSELAGLKDGDRILRVNGTYVDEMDHSRVVDLVKESGASVTFHVLDVASYKQAKTEGVDLSDPHPKPTQPTMNGVAGEAPKPKLCYLAKSSGGYGFSLRSVKGEVGMFMAEVNPGGAAEKAGVKANDRLIEVNGENMENATHDQIVEKVKASGSRIMFLLVDEDTDKFYKNKRIKLGAGLATVKFLPLKPRIVDLFKGSDGYGYFLKAEPNKTGHFIKDIDRGSPADRAGLKEMDRLVAVEGEEVDSCSHEQVVDRIRQCGNKCCLLVVDEDTDTLYKMGGVSPLFYLEEMGLLLPASPPPSYPECIPALAPTTTALLKLCKMEKTSAGYGFHLNSIQGVCGLYINEVVKGGAADRVGMEDDDIVVEVDGVNVEQSSHQQVVGLIRNSGSSLVLLVAGKQAYGHFKAKGVAITPQLLTPAPTARSPSPPPSPTARSPSPPPSPQPARSPSPPPPPAARHTPAQIDTPATLEEVREEEEEEEEEEEAKPYIPLPQTRERTPSVSSAASSSSSVDERL